MNRRRRAPLAWMNRRLPTTIMLLVVLAVCVVGALVAHADAAALRDRGVRVPAVVTEVHDAKSSWVGVRFTTPDGVVHRAQVGNYDWRSHPKVGDTPTLLVDPDDPEGDAVDVRMGPNDLAVWGFAVGAAVCASLIPPTWSGRLDWDKLRR